MLISLQGPIAQKGEVAMPSLLSDLFPISGPYKHSTALLKVCPRGNQAPTGEEKQKHFGNFGTLTFVELSKLVYRTLTWNICIQDSAETSQPSS